MPRSHEELRALYLKNAKDPNRATYQGFTTEEVADWNRRIMYGEPHSHLYESNCPICHPEILPPGHFERG